MKTKKSPKPRATTRTTIRTRTNNKVRPGMRVRCEYCGEKFYLPGTALLVFDLDGNRRVLVAHDDYALTGLEVPRKTMQFGDTPYVVWGADYVFPIVEGKS
jgi:hypothetical protein